MTPEKQTFSVREAAELLGVGRSTIYDAIERNEIPAVRIGRRRLVIPAYFINSKLRPADAHN